MNGICNLKYVFKLNFPAPIINVVMVTFQRLETQRTKPLNNLKGTRTFAVKPYSQIRFHESHTFKLGYKPQIQKLIFFGSRFEYVYHATVSCNLANANSWLNVIRLVFEVLLCDDEIRVKQKRSLIEIVMRG